MAGSQLTLDGTTPLRSSDAAGAGAHPLMVSSRTWRTVVVLEAHPEDCATPRDHSSLRGGQSRRTARLRARTRVRA